MQAVDMTRVWNLLLNTAAAASVTSSGPGIAAQLDGRHASAMDAEECLAAGSPPEGPGVGAADGSAVTHWPQVPTHVAMGGRSGLQMLVLPPPQARDDPLAVVDLCRAAEVGIKTCPCTTIICRTRDLTVSAHDRSEMGLASGARHREVKAKS